jgi:hypothetical protein
LPLGGDARVEQRVRQHTADDEGLRVENPVYDADQFA